LPALSAQLKKTTLHGRARLAPPRHIPWLATRQTGHDNAGGKFGQVARRLSSLLGNDIRRLRGREVRLGILAFSANVRVKGRIGMIRGLDKTMTAHHCVRVIVTVMDLKAKEPEIDGWG